MKVEIIVDKNCNEPEVKIYTSSLTQDIVELQNVITSFEKSTSYLKGYLDEDVYFIPFEEIEAIYSENKKVFLRTEKETYQLKQRLYEIESILPGNDFIRISNSEIINLNKVKSINTRILGSIVITFYSGYKTYSSRRYIAKIKEVLGV